MPKTSWRMGFHIMPATGWLNDPNGLCQLDGTYHVFHQYSPDWPDPGAPRGWAHLWSRDLAHWSSAGAPMVIAPDTAEDADGAYSGSAVATPDGVRLYYTGNVKEPGDHDYVHDGRGANQILVESPDGFALGEKNVLLRNADYPAFCSCHVRDPKVWRDGSGWWMLLGARDLDDRGLVLRLRSADGLSWRMAGTVRTDEPLGYMWECPDRIALGGREWLSMCPQGMLEDPWSGGLEDVSGYLPLPEGRTLAADGDMVLDRGAARLWDHGFDFYAPQTFVDESGRTLLMGWMGNPHTPWESAPDGMSWCHCLTVPREVLPGAGGALLQRPVPELEGLRGARHELAAAGALELPEHRADVCLEVAGPAELTLDGALSIGCDGRSVRVSFLEGDVAAGRGSREAACADDVRDLRMLVDSSAVEVYANGGEVVFSTRWFPRQDRLSLELSGAARGAAWEMGDGMAGTYE